MNIYPFEIDYAVPKPFAAFVNRGEIKSKEPNKRNGKQNTEKFRLSHSFTATSYDTGLNCCLVLSSCRCISLAMTSKRVISTLRYRH